MATPTGKQQQPRRLGVRRPGRLVLYLTDDELAQVRHEAAAAGTTSSSYGARLIAAGRKAVAAR